MREIRVRLWLSLGSKLARPVATKDFPEEGRIATKANQIVTVLVEICTLPTEGFDPSALESRFTTGMSEVPF